MIGQTVGNYQVTAFLGKGGMGQVYLAEHPRIGRKVAIKLLHSELSADRRLVERLFDEALATNLVKHAGIVQVFDCGFHNDRAYLVMEFLEGETLASVLRRVQVLPVPVACALGAQLASALGAAHDHQIVHRDLKPDNIFVMNARQNDVTVKIVDFGIAKLTFRPTGSDTDSSVLLGTPAYMSPEQCAGARLVDPRTDIYALGCILFELVVGQRPFVYQGWGEYIAAHQNESPPIPSTLRPALPEALNALILQTLAKRPEDRPASMAEVEQRLIAVRDVQVSSTSVTPPLLIVKAPSHNTAELAPLLRGATEVSRRQQVVIRQRHRGRWLVALGAAGVLVATGALWWRTSSPEVKALPAHERERLADARSVDARVAAVPVVAAPVEPPVPTVPVVPTTQVAPTAPVAPPAARPPARATPKRPTLKTPAAKRPPIDRFRGFEDL